MKIFLLLAFFFLTPLFPVYSHEGNGDIGHPETKEERLPDIALKSYEEIIRMITDGLKQIKKQVEQSINEIQKNVQP